MTDLLEVTVDLDNTKALEEHGSLDNGVYGIDKDGVYHMWYGSKNYLVEFTRPEFNGSPDEDPEYGNILMENTQ